jgi:hypothetical protein
MEFIGRFIMRSIDDAWDDRTDDQAVSTWTRLASMAPSWRFGFRRRKIQVNRDAIRLTKDAAEVIEAREAASRLR